jgi:hypothetical protein
LGGPGADSGDENDVMLFDTGKINKSETPIPGQGQTSATRVQGQRREEGEESYIEIRAPTHVGTRSSVPYNQVLPSYKKKAESAIERSEIPKEHQKRVREYFESLERRR